VTVPWVLPFLNLIPTENTPCWYSDAPCMAPIPSALHPTTPAFVVSSMHIPGADHERHDMRFGSALAWPATRAATRTSARLPKACLVMLKVASALESGWCGVMWNLLQNLESAG